MFVCQLVRYIKYLYYIICVCMPICHLLYFKVNFIKDIHINIFIVNYYNISYFVSVFLTFITIAITITITITIHVINSSTITAITTHVLPIVYYYYYFHTCIYI